MKNHYQKNYQILEKKVEVKVLEEVMVFISFNYIL